MRARRPAGRRPSALSRERHELGVGELRQAVLVRDEVRERFARRRARCAQAERRPRGQQRPRRAAGLGEAAARRLVGVQEPGRSRGDSRCEQQPHAHTTSAFRRRAYRSSTRRSSGPATSASTRLPDRVRDVEREPARARRGERLPRVRVEAEPEPDVHQRRRTRSRARSRSSANGTRRRSSGAARPPSSAAAAPGEHLPRRVGALAEEDVRGDRGERRPPRSPRRGPSATPEATTITVTGCTLGIGGEQHAPGGGDAAEGRDEREVACVDPGPLSSQASPRDDERDRDEQQSRAPPSSGRDAAQAAAASAAPSAPNARRA